MSRPALSFRCILAVGLFVLACAMLPGSATSGASDRDELKVKREAEFEFAQTPHFTRSGDRVTIAFETKGFCDVTVAVEDETGKIIRHLASGVLGPNAPEPFQTNSKKQVVVWDGKDDRGVYIDEKDRLTVQVSLGLKPQFEKTLYYSPYKRFGRNSPLVAPTPEGVYVCEGDILDSVRLFDHEGNYIRTVYPFPADKIDQVKGLRWHPAPQDGANVPFKEGFYHSTFFNSGYNSGFDATTGYGVTHFPTLAYSWAEDAPDFPAATAFAVSGRHIALAGPLGVNRMATDGSTGDMDLAGARYDVTAFDRDIYGKPYSVRVGPRSAALSPDGKWLYLTGYSWRDDSKYSDMYSGGRRWLHGVLRMRFDAEAAPEVFVGSNKVDAEPGNGSDQLCSPVSVTCDAQGNVYVADCGNDRVQIFTPDGKLKESIPVERPTSVGVHRKTGELYVFSWSMRIWAPRRTVNPTLTRLGPAEKREKIASYSLPVNLGRSFGDTIAGGLQYRAELDSWAEPPVVWLVPGTPVMAITSYEISNISWMRGAIKILAVDRDKLAVKKDFGKETLKETARDARPGNSRQLLTADPKTGRLYVFEPRVANDQAVEIDPGTGTERLVDLPHGADEIAFDLDGLVYLRTATMVTRFDPAKNWREVRWDYGEERDAVGGGHGSRAAHVLAGLVLPGAHPSEPSETCCGGFGLSPRGLLVAQCWNGEIFSAGMDRRKQEGIAPLLQRYIPQVYPGRQRWGEIHVWDPHGRIVHLDATPGVTITDGVAIDKDGNLYVLTNPTRAPDGQQTLNPKTETLIKFKPGKGKVITSGNQTITGPEGVRIPVLLKKGAEPDGPTQMAGRHQPAAWVQGAEWMYGGVGFASGGDTCWNARCALDLYARSFAPEFDHFSVAVLDTNGNLITRIGRYGNLEDGKPSVPHPAIREGRSIGGDEVALMHACYVGVDSDRRLFIADAGNRRVLSVRLDHHVSHRVALKDVPDSAGS